MRKLARVVLTLAVAAIIATPLMAEDKKKGKKKRKRGRRTIQVVRLPKSITLSDEQKAKVAAINKEFGPKFREIFQKQNKVITPEQRKARTEALKAARAAGKKGKELRDAVNASFKVTEEQKKQLKEFAKARGEIQKQVRAKIFEILTADQKAKLRAGKKKGKRKKKKKADK